MFKTILAAACAVAVAVLSTACIEEAHASPHVGLELAREAPAAAGYNSAGNAVFNQLRVSDGTGFATTVAAAGTPVAVTHATLITAQAEDGSLCITDTPTGGSFTVAACGQGKVRLSVCLGDVIGVNSATWTAGIYRTRSASTSAVSALIREVEPGTADRESAGCIEAVDSAQTGDVYTVRVDSGTNADTVTIRQMSFGIEKLSSL